MYTWNHLAKQHANKANSKQSPEELNLGNFMNPILSLFFRNQMDCLLITYKTLFINSLI